jgi:hypothetical protein
MCVKSRIVLMIDWDDLWLLRRIYTDYLLLNWHLFVLFLLFYNYHGCKMLLLVSLRRIVWKWSLVWILEIYATKWYFLIFRSIFIKPQEYESFIYIYAKHICSQIKPLLFWINEFIFSITSLWKAEHYTYLKS